MKVKYNLEIIERSMIENLLDKFSFCKFCDISETTFDKIFSNNFDIDLLEIYKIVINMNIKEDDLLIYEKTE